MKFPKLNLLIVESNSFLVRILQNALAADFNIILASNPLEARELLKKGVVVDFIITDLSLSKADGMDLIQRVRKSTRYHSLPILVLSGSEDSNTRISCLENGADDCMTKPFNPLEVRAKIQAMLRRSGNPVSRVTAGTAPWYGQLMPIRA
ncbi:response regulator [Larkinella knui]|uniref:Response regulator n=1 Tax=Larkinella knui TaxID=2025310 RepID=A0A3P1CUD0_9BACT|nr:response regulator transcription factor [Larkinella knui]RRB16746.1 response regulator [Larkinella knui]